jgi:hypothetical protein
MATLFLIAQGGLMGMVAGRAFPGGDWASPEFWACCVANSVLVVLYGVVNK